MRIQDVVHKLEGQWSSAGRVDDVGSFDVVESALAQPLPADYKYFLMWSDGGECLPPLQRFTFYSLDELLPRRVDGQPPDALEFGTDDSQGFAFDLSVNRDTGQYPIVSYPLGDTTRMEVQTQANDLAAFLGGLLEVE